MFRTTVQTKAVVSDSTKILILKQFTTNSDHIKGLAELYLIVQRY